MVHHNKNDAPTAANKTNSLHLPPLKSRIAYKLTDSDELQEDFVHSKAGKATGKYCSHLNIQSPKNNEIEEYNFSSDIVEWYPITEEVMIVNNKDLDSITAAKEKELKNWRDTDVYCEVEGEGQNTVSCRWVIETREREIFIKPPKEADSQGIWRLNKCVYGLKEASRYWYNRVHDEFLNMGLHKSKYDDAVFFYKPNKNGQCEGIIVIHVDDFLYGGSSHFEKFTNEVHRKFIVGSDCDVPFKSVGIDINMDRVSLTVNQQSYILMGSKK